MGPTSWAVCAGKKQEQKYKKFFFYIIHLFFLFLDINYEVPTFSLIPVYKHILSVKPQTSILIYSGAADTLTVPPTGTQVKFFLKKKRKKRKKKERKGKEREMKSGKDKRKGKEKKKEERKIVVEKNIIMFSFYRHVPLRLVVRLLSFGN